MKGISIKVIPHELQRYETSGDWWYERDNTWAIRVSKMTEWRYEFLIAIHEMAEMAWCHQFLVTEQEVTNFDIDFEEKRKKGEVAVEAEPGDDPTAPYYVGHQVATIVERCTALALGVVWDDYQKEVLNLYNGK